MVPQCLALKICILLLMQTQPMPLLAGAGKTHWALRHVEEELDRRYVLLGANPILAQMRVGVYCMQLLGHAVSRAARCMDV